MNNTINYTAAPETTDAARSIGSVTNIALVNQGAAAAPGEAVIEVALAGAAQGTVISVSHSDQGATVTGSSAAPDPSLNVTTVNATSELVGAGGKGGGLVENPTASQSGRTQPPPTPSPDLPEPKPADGFIITEKELGFTLNELKAKGEPAWHSIFAILKPYSLGFLSNKRFARNWPLTTQDFEEIINDTVLDIFGRIQNFQTWKELETYFLQALSSTAVDQIRRDCALIRGGGLTLVTNYIPLEHYSNDIDPLGLFIPDAAEPDVLNWSSLSEVFDDEPLPFRAAHITHLRPLLEKCLASLKNKDERNLLVVVYLDGVDPPDLAPKHGITARGVEKRVERALQRLRGTIPTHLRQELLSLYRPQGGHSTTG
jgi:RNA polymerase sigma factor (sigma-70 family)